MLNTVVMYVGVTENSNVCPPSCVKSADGVVRALAAKSDASPVAAPFPLETKIVHSTAVPTRAGDVLMQVIDDAVVGIP